jgi:signal transduction histidine kinase
LELTWDASPRVPVRGDASRLRQLITNLLDNAIKFTDPGGRVSVQAGRDGQQARLLVSDTGVGIPDDRLPHIFERFYQVDPARSSTGSGLGLSISRWIAEAHGGSIGVASGPGRGSTFAVTLPMGADGDQAGGGSHG